MIDCFQDLTHDALALALRHILKLVMYNATMRMAHGLLSPSYIVILQRLNGTSLRFVTKPTS